MARKSATPGRRWMNLTLPSIGLAFAIACLIALVVMFLGGCAAPATTITFLGTGTPDKTGVFVFIDMTFAPGVDLKGGTVYPHEWVDTVPFSHHQVAGKGTVTSYIFRVTPTEPGQVVECFTIFNGNAAAPVDHARATYPKAAVCGGPPV